MKKKYLVVFLSMIILLTGCSFKKEKDILNETNNKVNKLKSYYLSGEMEMFNNETTYKYDVKVSYLKNNNFKVSLKNKSNDHEQIILRNSEGVYIVTPSLNKSFKFQSDWPYNNSQAYLLQCIIKDLKNDDKTTLEKKDNLYIYTGKVNYSNNKELVKQKVTINDSLDIKKVEIIDDNNNVKIRMLINEIDYDPRFSDDYFTLESNVLYEIEESTSVSKIDDINYPMYIPANTSLSSQDKINSENSDRVILTFDGETPFTLIEESLIVTKDLETTPIKGDIVLLGDSFGIMDESSITWIIGDRQYYLVSKDLSNAELVEVARSVSSIPVLK